MIARKLDRYIFSEMLPPFFLSMAILTLVLFLQKLFRLADLVVSKGVTLASTIKVLAYLVPSFLVITIPMSLLVASLTTFASLSASSEITAMKASRISLYRMIRPVIIFAVLSFAVTAATSLVLVPGANIALKAHLFSMVRSQATVGIDPGVFSSMFDGMAIYVDKMDSLYNMEGVFISDERSEKDPYVILAKRGKLIADQQSLKVTFDLREGSIHTSPKDERTYTQMNFDAARLYLDLNDTFSQAGAPGKGFEDMGTLELSREIKRLGNAGQSTSAPETELHKRITIPFVCLILGLIGAPLGIRQSRSGKSAGVALSLLVFLVYYIILATSTNLAETGIVRPALAFWLPNSLMAAAAVLFVAIKGQELNFMIFHRLSNAFSALKKRIPWTS